MARIATVESKFSMNKIFVVGAVLVVLVLAAIIMAAKPNQGGGNVTTAAPAKPASYSAGALTAAERPSSPSPSPLAFPTIPNSTKRCAWIG